MSRCQPAEPMSGEGALVRTSCFEKRSERALRFTQFADPKNGELAVGRPFVLCEREREL